MKKIILTITTLILFFIESSYLSKLPIMNITLPITYTFCIIASIYGDEWDAVFLGLLMGLLQDSYTANLFGLHMFLNMNIFLGAKIISNYLRKDRTPIIMVYAGLISMITNAIAYVMHSLFSYYTNPKTIPIIGLYVMVLSFVMIILVKKIYNLHMVKRAIRNY